MKKNILLSTTIVFGLAFISCNKKSTDDTTTTASEDSSTSGAAASSVGGAIAGSDTNGKMAWYSPELSPSSPLISALLPSAFAATTCPKITTANGSGCTNASNAVDLTFSSCSHGTSAATWSGTLEVSLSSGTAISCGTFPSPGSGVSIRRQFVSSAGVPGTATRTSAKGTVVTIDHQTSNLANFDNQTIAANIGSGYGSTVTFNGSGARTAAAVKQRVYVSGGFDHSVVGSVTISEVDTTRTVSGSLTVYHNKVKVVATSTFSNVVYNNTSCVPVSGSISTSFAAGTNVSPTTLGSALVGKTETLTFNSDGTATLVDYSGTSSTVQLTHCY